MSLPLKYTEIQSCLLHGNEVSGVRDIIYEKVYRLSAWMILSNSLMSLFDPHVILLRSVNTRIRTCLWWYGFPCSWKISLIDFVIDDIYKVVTLPEKKCNVVLLLLLILTCDHFVKVCIKGLVKDNKKARSKF